MVDVVDVEAEKVELVVAIEAWGVVKDWGWITKGFISLDNCCWSSNICFWIFEIWAWWSADNEGDDES